MDFVGCKVMSSCCLMKSLYLHFNGKLKYWRGVIFFYMFARVFDNRFEKEYKVQPSKY